MSDSNRLVRMVYASKASFKPFDTEHGIDGNVAHILATARRRNRKNGLVGALYYGNGCFFQCLEGQQSAVDELYSHLLLDPRHHDLKILQYMDIEEVGFLSWEMKFAMVDREIRNFLRANNMIKFDPYRFNHDMIDTLVEILYDADEEAPEEKIAPIVQQISQLEQHRVAQKHKFLFANVALILLILIPTLVYTQYLGQ